MKKLIKTCAVMLLVAAAAVIVLYRTVNRVPSADLPKYEQVYRIFEDGGCLSCHSSDPELPFYAKLPVAGSIVMKDIDSGYRAYDMEKFMNEIWRRSKRWYLTTACLCLSIILFIGAAR